MKRWVAFGLVGVLALAGTWWKISEAVAADKKIEDAMKALHKGKTPVHKGLEEGLDMTIKDKDLKWDEIEKLAKRYADLTADLHKLNPGKGDPKSWEKLAKEYNADAKELVKTVATKNRKATEKAFEKLDTSCKACHKEHRE